MPEVIVVARRRWQIRKVANRLAGSKHVLAPACQPAPEQCYAPSLGIVGTRQIIAGWKKGGGSAKSNLGGRHRPVGLFSFLFSALSRGLGLA